MSILIKKFEDPKNGTFKIIELSNGQPCFVSCEDFEELSAHPWFPHKYGKCTYAVRKSRRPGSTYFVRMHRQVTKCPKNKVVHHINHNCLDNRRENLKIMDHKEHRDFHQFGILTIL